MAIAQRLKMCRATCTKQAALGHKGLVQVTVGVQQQTDGRQVTLGQPRARLHLLADAAHTQPSGQQQQNGQADDRQGNLPAKREVSKQAQHGKLQQHDMTGVA